MTSPDEAELLETVRRERESAKERDLQRQHFEHVLKIDIHTCATSFTATCACGLWAIENHKVSHPIDQDAARSLVISRHDEHRLSLVATVELGYSSSGKCVPYRSTDGHGQVVTGHIHAGAARRNRCQVCKRNWSIAQCDYPLEGKCPKCKGEGVKEGYNCHDCAGTGRRMCNRHLCIYCVAHREPDEDYCPEHRVAAGFPPLLKRERCHWIDNGAHHGGRCLHRGCGKQVEPGERALYFSDRKRVMCAVCGEAYLKVAVVER